MSELSITESSIGDLRGKVAIVTGKVTLFFSFLPYVRASDKQGG